MAGLRDTVLYHKRQVQKKTLLQGFWWRRGELNPRPKKALAGRLRAQSLFQAGIDGVQRQTPPYPSALLSRICRQLQIW